MPSTCREVGGAAEVGARRRSTLQAPWMRSSAASGRCGRAWYGSGDTYLRRQTRGCASSCRWIRGGGGRPRGSKSCFEGMLRGSWPLLSVAAPGWWSSLAYRSAARLRTEVGPAPETEERGGCGQWFSSLVGEDNSPDNTAAGTGDPGVRQARILTDDDFDYLKGCVHLGFGFIYNKIPELCDLDL